MDLWWVTIALIIFMVTLLGVYAVYMSAAHGVFVKLGIPGPKPLPVLGNFHQQVSQGTFNFQVNMYNRYADSKVYGIFDTHTPTMVIRDLDMIRDICVKNFNSFVNHRIFDMPKPVDRMLTMIKGDDWKNIRSTVSPAFSTVKLRRLFQHIIHNSRSLTESLRDKEQSGEPVELKDLVSRFTMDVIASTGFGIQTNSLKDEGSEFMVRSKRLMGSGLKMILLSFFLPFLTKTLKRIGLGLLRQDDLDFFSAFVDDALERRKKETNHGRSKRHDFLQLLMEADAEGGDLPNDNMAHAEAQALKTVSERQPLSRTDVQAQAIIFLMAGFDTVSTVLSFTFFLLAQNPDCCARLQQEIEDKLGNGVPTYDSMQDMPYMDQVLNEAMRLYPPGLQLDRLCNEDVEVGGVHIPKNMVVIFPAYAIHHDPKIWTDPETFDPERFSMESKQARHPYAHLPFGQGPRSCVGMRLALLELKVALSVILQEMTPVPCEKTVYPVKLKFFQVAAEDGLWVKFQTREQKTEDGL